MAAKQRTPKLHLLVGRARSIDLYKDTGTPAEVAARYGFRELQGSHLVGHTRMATESAVTPERAHPFTAGEDFCLVHNGSLSNPYSVRRKLEPLGIKFETDNDTEAACRFLEWRMREGDSLETALEKGFDELDGFYTFLMGTQRRAGAGARCVRVQAGDRRRDRRLRRDLVGVPLAREAARREERERSSSPSPRRSTYGERSAFVRGPRPTRVTFDLAQQPLRELNQFLHHELRARHETCTRAESGRRAQHRRRRRRAGRHRDRRPRRLLRGRNEPAGHVYRPRQRRTRLSPRT